MVGIVLISTRYDLSTVLARMGCEDFKRQKKNDFFHNLAQLLWTDIEEHSTQYKNNY